MRIEAVRNYVGAADLILILLLAILPAAMIVFNILSLRGHDPATVSVYVEGDLYGKYDLNVTQEIEIGGRNMLRIEDGRVSMIYADCPDQVCVHTPPLSREFPGHIVCLPNSVVVSIEYTDSGQEIDGYVS